MRRVVILPALLALGLAALDSAAAQSAVSERTTELREILNRDQLRIVEDAPLLHLGEACRLRTADWVKGARTWMMVLVEIDGRNMRPSPESVIAARAAILAGEQAGRAVFLSHRELTSERALCRLVEGELARLDRFAAMAQGAAPE